MSSFLLTSYSNKVSACRRLADHIADAAIAMDLNADISTSNQSASHYVCVSNKEEIIKIRCSDHENGLQTSDWYVWDDECPSKTIARIAQHFGCYVPNKYRPESYAKPSYESQKAAKKRQTIKKDTVSTVVNSFGRNRTLQEIADIWLSASLVDA
jgi:hypothetical protein